MTRPYTPGTRVVLVWWPDAAEIGSLGSVAGKETLIKGTIVRNGAGGTNPGALARLPHDAQRVAWDEGYTGWVPICWIRPLADPDGVPVVEYESMPESGPEVRH
jgi:hypothetical protein